MTFVRYCAQATQDFLTRNSMQMAAAIAFYSFFSLFPLSLLIILGYGVVAGMENIHDDALVRVIGAFIPVSQPEITETIKSVAQRWDWRATGPLAFAGVVWASTAVFATLRKGINAAWGIFTPRPFLRERVMDLSVTAGAGLLFVCMLYSTGFVHSLQPPDAGLAGTAWRSCVGLAISFPAFSFLYWFLPNRPVRYRDVLFGALVAAIAFEGAKVFFLIYSAKREALDQVYGPLTAVAVLLGWLYVSAALVLIGSHITSVYVGLLQTRLVKPADVWSLGLLPLARRVRASRSRVPLRG